MSSVFLSHNSKDKPWVRKLAKLLTADGIVVWLDEAELNIGDSLIDKISTAIDEMKFVAAVISRNSIASAWVQKELSLAMSKEIKGRRVTVLPLLIEQCDLPAALRDKLYADFTSPDNFESEYNKLLRALGVDRAGHASPAERIATAATKNETNDTSGELRIVGIAKERTRQDRTYAGLQDYFLQLSSRPSAGWAAHFMEARRYPRHSMWREAWVEGDCVVIKCALDELSRYHMNDLKEDVVTANINLTRANAAAEQMCRQQAERAEQERRVRDAELDKLKFD
jgi:hypothetical protein